MRTEATRLGLGWRARDQVPWKDFVGGWWTLEQASDATGGTSRLVRDVAEPNDQKSWMKHLQRQGWVLERGGKHQVKMTKPSCRPITLPMSKGAQYPKGLNAAIRRQVGV